MITSLLLSIKVVLPLAVFMGLGYLIRYKNWVSQITVKEMNTVVFKLFLSTMVFNNIYKSNISDNFNLNLLIYAVISLMVMFSIISIVVSFFIKEKTIAPVIIQGLYRSNFVLFGLQVTASICGKDNLGITTILISVIIPMFNVLAVILFEIYRGGTINTKRLAIGILTNPLIIASILGLLFLFSNIRFNVVIEETLSDISQIATPMSLILLGATVTLGGIKKYKKYLVVCTLGRLIIIPSIFIGIGILLGFRNVELVALMVMLASPTAVSSFSMAAQMDGDSELAGQIVAVTTVFSAFTIFLWTYFLNIMNFI